MCWVPLEPELLQSSSSRCLWVCPFSLIIAFFLFDRFLVRGSSKSYSLTTVFVPSLVWGITRRTAFFSWNELFRLKYLRLLLGFIRTRPPLLYLSFLEQRWKVKTHSFLKLPISGIGKGARRRTDKSSSTNVRGKVWRGTSVFVRFLHQIFQVLERSL